jgi:hypothetical protein
MAKKTTSLGSFRRCFVTGSLGQKTHALVRMLMAMGVEATTADMLNTGTAITQEILRMIAASDFIAVVLGERGRDNALYEMGVARALGKPAFVILTHGALGVDVSGVYLRAIDGPERIADVADDLDRFLRNAKTPTPLVGRIAGERRLDLGWARRELSTLRSRASRGRERQLEQLVGKIFEAVGAEVLPTASEGRMQVDFVVWLDQIADQTGGPMLVECKLFRGGSGSVIKNSEASVRRLERTLADSDSSIALLVYDHDRSHTPPSLYETPQVLSFAVEDLVSALEKGGFEQELLRRRERAAFAHRSD